MMESMDKHYRILGLEPNASPEKVRQAYKDLVQVWHPDRFAYDPELQRRAQEKLKLINESYEKLRSYHLAPLVRARSNSAVINAARQQRVSPKRAGIKALVVDDDPDVCDLLRDYLVDKGYQVRVAYDGDEALSAYKRERADVVILDVRMPRKDGLETLRELKALDSRTAVIMVSGFGDDEIINKAEALGAFYIHKPFNLRYLQSAIETKLGLRSGIVDKTG